MQRRLRPLSAALPLAAMAAALIVGAHEAMAQNLMSQSLIKPGEETLTVNLGGIVNQFDTTFRLDGQTRRGSDINLEGNGLNNNLSSFEVGATWRLLPRHRIDAQYFSAKRSGDRQYGTEITIGDEVFPIGATVSAEAKSEFLLADYRYSFMKTDQIELAGLLGFYGGHFKFNVNATGNETPTPRTANRNVSTTVPLPLIGATVDWYINPRWKIAGAIEGIAADIGDVDGSAFVAVASTEYTLVRNFGVGLRYMYSDMRADVSKSDFNGNITWKMNSVSLYAKLLF